MNFGVSAYDGGQAAEGCLLREVSCEALKRRRRVFDAVLPRRLLERCLFFIGQWGSSGGGLSALLVERDIPAGVRLGFYTQRLEDGDDEVMFEDLLFASGFGGLAGGFE